MKAVTTNGATHPLKSWRFAHKCTLETFAERIGRTAATVSRYEAGLQGPSLEALQAIERETGGKVKARHFYGRSA